MNVSSLSHRIFVGAAESTAEFLFDQHTLVVIRRYTISSSQIPQAVTLFAMTVVVIALFPERES
jgi:hypothetical protein